MAVWLKQGVLGYLAPPMRRCRGRLIRYYALKGKDFYETSRGEGEHKEDSCHYEACAIDFRRQGITFKEINEVCGFGFDVVEYEDLGIFHVEYDPKRMKVSR